MIGKTIAQYRILEKLGEGGMGVVYKAEDTRLHRSVALKFIPSHRISSPKDTDRLAREAQAAASLHHPNIATIFAFDEYEDPTTHSTHPYIAMEFVEGTTLRQLLRSGAFKPSQVLSVATQLLRALEVAHGKGIIHRDLKPENIMVTAKDEVKILDFGIARRTESDLTTTRQAIAGSVAYMSPEQASGARLDSRSDLFSLGIILYEATTGQRPFRAEHSAALLYTLVNEDPPPPSRLRSELPQDLDQFIMRLLQKKPEDRFSSASEALAAVTTAAPPAPKSSRTIAKSFQLGAAIIGTLGVVALGVFLLQAPETEEMPPVSDRIALAVMYFENNSNDRELDWLEKGIPDMLITTLNQSKYLQVVSLDRIQGIVRTMSGPASSSEGRQDRIAVARRANARVMVSGSVVKAGNSLRVLVGVQDLAHDRIIGTDQVQIDDVGQVFDAVDRLAGSIVLLLELRAAGAENLRTQIREMKTNSLDAYEQYVRGREALYRQYYDEAIFHLTQAVKLDSSFAHAYTFLSNAYEVLGEDRLAEEMIEKALRFSAGLSEIDRKSILHRSARIRSDWPAELEYLKELVILQPFDPHWHFLLGWHYGTHLRDYDRCIQEYMTSIALDSVGEPVYYSYLGFAALNRGNPRLAIESMQTYARLLPGEAVAHDALGEAYLITGEYDQARRQFEHALKLRPDFTSSLMNMGRLSQLLGQERSAEQLFTRALRLGLGRNLEEEGSIALALLSISQKRYPEAMKQATRALELDSVSLLALWALGLAKTAEGDLGEAGRLRLRAETIRAGSGSKHEMEFIHHLSGTILLAQGNGPEAVSQFQNALSLGPLNQSFFRHALAQAFVTNDELGQAQEELARLARFNPRYPPAVLLNAKVLETMNRPDDARREYRRLLELWKNADRELPGKVFVERRLNDLKSTR